MVLHDIVRGLVMIFTTTLRLHLTYQISELSKQWFYFFTFYDRISGINRRRYRAGWYLRRGRHKDPKEFQA